MSMSIDLDTIDQRINRRSRRPVWEIDREQDHFQMQKQHRMNEVKKRIDPGIMETLYLADMVDLQRRTLEHLESRTPLCIPVYNSLTLAPTDGLVHINFEHPDRTADPQKRQFRTPNMPLFSLDIKNDGTGQASVTWSHPAGDAYPVADVPIPSGENLQIHPEKHAIKWINLIASGTTNSSVRLYGMI